MTEPPAGDGPLAAGDFDDWLADLGRALHDGTGMEVPCGGCNACCRSAQFVHVEADESQALARIPEALLFPAPGSPGTMVMGFDEAGCCPMLEQDACSIYEQRPRACRIYDCRAFAATGLDPAEEGRDAVGARSRRWQFSYRNDASRYRHEAATRQAAAVRAGAGAPSTLTAVALIALRDVTGAE